MALEFMEEIINAEVHTNEEQLYAEMEGVCGSDLMSDALAFSRQRVLLLTGLVNPQVIRTAEMMDTRAMVLMSRSVSMFGACGLLYKSSFGGGG